MGGSFGKKQHPIDVVQNWDKEFWPADPPKPPRYVPDEGFQRALLAAEEKEKVYFPDSELAHLGGAHGSGYRIMSPSRARKLARNHAKPCAPSMLELSYQRLKERLAQAQYATQTQFPDRFLELQRAEDLSNFLNRADNDKLTNAEVSKLGEALAATQLAGRGARMDIFGQKSHSQEFMPNSAADAISLAQTAARDVAAQAFRCRATTFLCI
eukprot:TRINITY_DN79901_c0_g1_i1.p1 TRINITY_DN79901_c0_g1~~TRINITY_DN79901_c0_g1_i1.p1  ORF type:complete len:221 (+),score=44.30 TRINITY_DN79901_c0_g1_i1:28-663(+)